MYVKSIHFERTGGFAGIRLAANIEIDELPEEQKREILSLLDELDFDELPENAPGQASIPDEFVYSITVKSDKREHTVATGETSATDDMERLIETLQRIAKAQTRKK